MFKPGLYVYMFSCRLTQLLQHDCNVCDIILWGNAECQVTSTKSACLCHLQAEVVTLSICYHYVSNSYRENLL